MSYLSPEQAKGEPVGPAIDLYSLDIVLYEMLTGRVPFAADGPLASAIKHLTEVPPSVVEANPSVPHSLEAVVMGLLAKAPAERYEDARGPAQELERSTHAKEADFSYRVHPAKLAARRAEDNGLRRHAPRRAPRVLLYLACAGVLSSVALHALVNPVDLYGDIRHALELAPTPAISEASNPVSEELGTGKAVIPEIARSVSHDKSGWDVRENNADPAAGAWTPNPPGPVAANGTGDPTSRYYEAATRSSARQTGEQGKQPEQSQGTARIGEASSTATAEGLRGPPVPRPSRASPVRAEGATESWVTSGAGPPPTQPVTNEQRTGSAATAAPASPTPSAWPRPARTITVQHQSWQHATPQSATPQAPKSAAADPMAGERVVDVRSAPVARTENVSVASSGWRGIPEGSIGTGAASPIANVHGTGREESALRVHERRPKYRSARR